MNLVQKLPIGLGLACMMMLSSCSKEDGVAPARQPDAESIVASGANLKTRGYTIPSTQGPVTGNASSSSLLPGWNVESPSLAGVSNYSNILGDPLAPWQNPLPVVFPGPSSFVTIKAFKSAPAHSAIGMKGLIPGKKYKVTFSLSTSKRLGSQMPYSESADVRVGDLDPHIAKKTIYFAGKEGQWITDSIIFTATKETHGFYVFSRPDTENVFTYLNILVKENALQQLD
ncbi:hypothetical protein [Dyadobacter aurulentus]|uniref:hypothetical protein n=1 Tax=Dyadobacter sp. UC 10 TaxID=2605428 RepID=UPI0011F10ADF|nr:hypothetical protein [Dyadobacter sp. UC 10]KAA0990862.1 hypothetical protein FXO21_12210 [Dyadobacter sp. UC 10]